MGGQLPTPRTPEQDFLAGVCGRLDDQNVILAQILDRLPAPVKAGAGPEGASLIEESTTAAGVAAGDQTGDVSPTSTAAPAPPATAKKAAAKRPPAKRGASDG